MTMRKDRALASHFVLIGLLILVWAIWPTHPAWRTPIAFMVVLISGWMIGGWLSSSDRTLRGTRVASGGVGCVRRWIVWALAAPIFGSASLFLVARQIGWPVSIGFLDTQAYFLAHLMSEAGAGPRLILSVIPREALYGASEAVGQVLGRDAPYAAPWSGWAGSALAIRYSLAAGMGGALIGAAVVHWALAILSGDGCPVRLGTFELDRKAENRHILAIGGTGSGKSQTIRAGVRAARLRGNGALVLDIGGELMTRLFRPGVDRIIGAFDGRSEAWSPLAEMDSEADAMRLAAALIAIPESGEARVWAIKARSLAELVLIACWRLHLRGHEVTNATLIDFLTVGDPAELQRIVSRHPALGLFREGNERMLGSVLGVAGTCAQALRTLDPSAGFFGWSVSKWVAGGQAATGWLYVPVPASYQDSAFPLASLVAGTVIDSMLSLPEDESRRFWLFVDELGQYPAIADLSRGLTLGRKYGLAVVGAVQSISQLRENYSLHGAQTLLSCFSTKVIYRQGDPDSAEWASKQIGDRQVSRVVHSGSSSTDFRGQEPEKWSQQVVTEPAVLPSELADLPDRDAFLVSASLNGVRAESVSYIQLPPETTPAFVPASRIRGESVPAESPETAKRKPPARNRSIQVLDQLKNMGDMPNEIADDGGGEADTE